MIHSPCAIASADICSGSRAIPCHEVMVLRSGFKRYCSLHHTLS